MRLNAVYLMNLDVDTSALEDDIYPILTYFSELNVARRMLNWAGPKALWEKGVRTTIPGSEDDERCYWVIAMVDPELLEDGNNGCDG